MKSIFSIDHHAISKHISEYFKQVDIICSDYGKVNTNTKYLVLNGASTLECLEVIKNKKLTSVVQNSIQSLSDKLAFLKKIHHKSEDYFDRKFSLVDSDISVQEFDINDDRNEIIEKSFSLSGVEMDMARYQYVYQVANELIMNAQIDAPKLSSGANNSKSVFIVEKNTSKGLIALSVVDYFGSLNPDKMIGNIFSAHKDGFRHSMSHNSIGAGLGAALIFDLVDSLIIGVIEEKVTRVSALLPYGLSAKKNNNIQKSLHIIKG